MPIKTLLRAFSAIFLFFFPIFLKAQVIITPYTNATAMAQRLVGDGITISNAQFTGANLAAGFFQNVSGTNIDIDSGIVLTTGRAKTININNSDETGVDGNGVLKASQALASNNNFLQGNPLLASALGVPLSQLKDACKLEFDFIPLGDTIRFNYIFSSEEYRPAYACPSGTLQYNDVFGFYISGPGISGSRNIALVPGTNLPVSIYNINNVLDEFGDPLCPSHPELYKNNANNKFMTHEGHTVVLQAVAKVVPCSTYHLTLVIADNTDGIYDSGVFIAAKSLSSNAIVFEQTTDATTTLIEGCTHDTIRISRGYSGASPQTINLTYQGTATNGVDYTLLPPTITIPAGASYADLIINPLTDALNEGTETVQILAFPLCGAASIPYDTINYTIVDPTNFDFQPDTIFQCGNAAVQLNAPSGYAAYNWQPNPTLSSTSIQNPVANPVNDVTVYHGSVGGGACVQTDSIVVIKKKFSLKSKQDTQCPNDNSGQIKVTINNAWASPQFSLNGGAYQSDSTFSGLLAGTYVVKVKDATCEDSITVTIIVTQPVPTVSSTTTPATCSGNPDGSITMTVSGSGTYQYSIDNGATWQASNVFNVAVGTYTILVKYGTNCWVTSSPITVAGIDNLTTTTNDPAPICEGNIVKIGISSSNATSYQWQPAPGLATTTGDSVMVNPTTTTKYYVQAMYGVCSKLDSVLVAVRPAPIPNAGVNITVCNGYNAQLNAISPATEYAWTPASFLDNPSISNPKYLNAIVSKEFYLKIKDANNCWSLVQDTVLVDVQPGINFQPDTVYQCNNLPVQLQTPSGYPGYQWDADPTLSSTTIFNPIANPVNHSTVYTGHVNVGACILSDSIVVIKKDIELISSNSTLCPQDNSGKIELGIGPEWKRPVTFKLGSNPPQSDSTFTNLVPGNYTITVTDADNCATPIDVTISMNEPTITINSTTTPASCSGNPDGSITLDVAGVPGTFTYSINSGTTRQASNLFNVVKGNYAVTINYGNNCYITSDSIAVPFVDNLTVAIAPKTPICEGTRTGLSASSPTATAYSWSGDNHIQQANTATPTVAPTGPTWYYVTATEGVCTKVDSIFVDILPAPIPDAGPNDTICNNTGSQLFSGNTNVAYHWTPVELLSNPSIQNPLVNSLNSTTRFYLKVVDQNGCWSLRADTALVFVIPPVDLFIGNDTMASMNQPIQLNVIDMGTSGVQSWEWWPTIGLDNPNSQHPIATYDQNITYVVTGTTAGGCIGKDTILISRYVGPEIYVPSAFTPNADGLNDVLRPIPIGIKQMKYFSVYNRWGQRVFHTQQMNKGWNGKINGVPQSPGTSFIWIAEGIDYLGNTIQRRGTFIMVH